jgi:hypothetical protein
MPIVCMRVQDPPLCDQKGLPAKAKVKKVAPKTFPMFMECRIGEKKSKMRNFKGGLGYPLLFLSPCPFQTLATGREVGTLPTCISNHV